MALTGPRPIFMDWQTPQALMPSDGNFYFRNRFPARLMNRLPLDLNDNSGDNLNLSLRNACTPVLMKDLFSADDAGVAFPAGQLWAVVGVNQKPGSSDHQTIAWAVPQSASGYSHADWLPQWPGSVGLLYPQNDQATYGAAQATRNAMRPTSIVFHRWGSDGGGVWSVPLTGANAWFPQCWNQRVWRWGRADPIWVGNAGAGQDTAGHLSNGATGFRQVTWSIRLTRVTVLTSDAYTYGRDTETLADSLTVSKIQVTKADGTVLWTQDLSWTLDDEYTFTAPDGIYQSWDDEKYQEYVASGSVDVSASALLSVGSMDNLRVRILHDGPALTDYASDADHWDHDPYDFSGTPRPDARTYSESGPFTDDCCVGLCHPSYTLQASPRIDVPLPWSMVGPGAVARGGYLAAWCT